MTEPRLVTNSELQAFKRCRRKWWLGSHRNLEVRSKALTGARETGTRVHRAMAHWYVPEGEVRIDPREALEKVLQEEVNEWLAANPDLDEEVRAAKLKDWEGDADLARAMVEGYVQWIEETGADSDLEIIAPEEPLAIEIYEHVYLAGRLDVRVRRRHDNVRLFLDHKTTGSFTDLMRKLRQDEQMMTYEILERAHVRPDERVAGAVYNMLRKVKRTSRAKPPFYDRTEVLHNEHELNSFRNRLLGTIAEVLRTEVRLERGEDPLTVVYPTPTGDCHWDCDFYPVCSMFDDGSRAEDLLAQYYQPSPRDHRYRDLEVP